MNHTFTYIMNKKLFSPLSPFPSWRSASSPRKYTKAPKCPVFGHYTCKRSFTPLQSWTRLSEFQYCWGMIISFNMRFLMTPPLHIFSNKINKSDKETKSGHWMQSKLFVKTISQSIPPPPPQRGKYNNRCRVVHRDSLDNAVSRCRSMFYFHGWHFEKPFKHF